MSKRDTERRRRWSQMAEVRERSSYWQILDQYNALVDTKNWSTSYSCSLVMSKWDSLTSYCYSSNSDTEVDRDNRCSFELDWRNTMLRHRNRRDMVHLSMENDWQTSSDTERDRRRTIEISSCCRYCLDTPSSHRRRARRMDRSCWSTMAREWKVRMANHRHGSTTMSAVRMEQWSLTTTLVLIATVAMRNRRT